MTNINLSDYSDFVLTLTSNDSKEYDCYIERLKNLKKSGCNISLLDTAISGLMAESGEAMEILKKVKFQGKEWTEDVRYHLKREAGDVIFYWIDLCIALGYTPDQIIAENIEKLQSRYPGGKFSVALSENRKIDDI